MLDVSHLSSATMAISLLIVTLLPQSITVHASAAPSDPFGDFLFSQTVELDMSSDFEEEDSLFERIRQPEEQEDEDEVVLQLFSIEQEEEPPLVRSEALYGDENCVVCSQTMEDSVMDRLDRWNRDLFFDQLELDEEDDDEEDDDDDGHSSMLSTVSIRRRQQVLPSVSSKTALKLRGGGGLLESEISRKLFVTALVTLVFEGLMGHILEFLKIVMQTSTSPTTYLAILSSITADKGLAGLWDGFVPWGVVQAVSKGAVFGLAHATATKLLVPMAKDGKLPMALALTLAGGIGGGFQGFVLSPTLLLKTRVMTNPIFREQMSLLRTTLLSFRIGYDVVVNEGLLTLMKGSGVFATKRVFDWASRYFFADLFESLYASSKGELTLVDKSLCSLMGGVASTCVTLPLDVLVAKTQDAKKAGVKVSVVKLMRDEFREKGLAGLRASYTKGFIARLLHVCLTTVVVKTGQPVVYEAMFGLKAATS